MRIRNRDVDALVDRLNRQSAAARSRMETAFALEDPEGAMLWFGVAHARTQCAIELDLLRLGRKL